MGADVAFILGFIFLILAVAVMIIPYDGKDYLFDIINSVVLFICGLLLLFYIAPSYKKREYGRVL